MRNLRKQLEEFISNAIEFERTIKLVSEGHYTGLKAYHNVTLKRLVEVRGVEFEDEGFTIECAMEYQTPGYTSYLESHQIYLHFNELEDFKVYKDMAEVLAKDLNTRALKTRERDREAVKQKELVELQRLKAKYESN
jgi:hypothetical protein